MSETKAASIPTAQEFANWLETFVPNYAINETTHRLIEGYRRLLVVAEKARPVIKRDDFCYPILHMTHMWSLPKLEELADALAALDAPVEEVK